MKNKEYKWYQDESVGGYIDDSGRLIVCEEYGTDADFDTHAVDVANGNGYSFFNHAFPFSLIAVFFIILFF